MVLEQKENLSRHLKEIVTPPELIIVGYTQGNDIEDDDQFPGGVYTMGMW